MHLTEDCFVASPEGVAKLIDENTIGGRPAHGRCLIRRVSGLRGVGHACRRGGHPRVHLHGRV